VIQDVAQKVATSKQDAKAKFTLPTAAKSRPTGAQSGNHGQNFHILLQAPRYNLTWSHQRSQTSAENSAAT